MLNDTAIPLNAAQANNLRATASAVARAPSRSERHRPLPVGRYTLIRTADAGEAAKWQARVRPYTQDELYALGEFAFEVSTLSQRGRPLYETWGYETFEDLCTRGLQMRAGMVYNARRVWGLFFHNKSAKQAARARALPFSRLFVLTGAVEKGRDLEELLGLAERRTMRELKELVCLSDKAPSVPAPRTKTTKAPKPTRRAEPRASKAAPKSAPPSNKAELALRGTPEQIEQLKRTLDAVRLIYPEVTDAAALCIMARVFTTRAAELFGTLAREHG